ncbi:kinase A inhibitor [Sporosarcina sp. NCCP-2716]|uniref:5-oxoprolinase subunit PxpB n=1 Tax=Sporosarcina sp. NCCP-2716 TaxID=2943679 RepID=UPI002041462B|nr:5-oxoprolinase subunit PxpB [Sporosarcina sp. NCCP-2716]GKV70492.1 kinase A inhibitor [Sporosarcina sp. NCCP-2716]
MTQHTLLTIQPLGDSAVTITLGQGIHPEVHQKVKGLSRALEEQPFDGMIETVPSYNKLTVYYSPFEVYRSQSATLGTTAFEMVTKYIQCISETIHETAAAKGRLIELPVLYGGYAGPDLAFVAQHNGLSIEEVIDIHANGEYLVYMIGFAPGFPFLGGMDEKIATPRKETPRTAIPAGSVGIAGMQTGVYPLKTPGGWQIIGHTPTPLFLPELSPPSYLQAGDRVKFRPVTEIEYKQLKKVTS